MNITLVTQLRFCTVRHPSSSVLICSQSCPVNSLDLNLEDYHMWGMSRMTQEYVYLVPIRKTEELWQWAVAC